MADPEKEGRLHRGHDGSMRPPASSAGHPRMRPGEIQESHDAPQSGSGPVFKAEDFPALGSPKPSPTGRPQTAQVLSTKPAQGNSQDVVPLEQRLRGMILNNLGQVSQGPETTDESPPAPGVFQPRMQASTGPGVQGHRPPGVDKGPQLPSSSRHHRKASQGVRREHPAHVDSQNTASVNQAHQGMHGLFTPAPPMAGQPTAFGGPHLLPPQHGRGIPPSQGHMPLHGHHVPGPHQPRGRGSVAQRGRGGRGGAVPSGPPVHNSGQPPKGGQPQPVDPAAAARSRMLLELQSRALGDLALSLVASIAIDAQEVRAKEAFRALVEHKAREAIASFEMSQASDASFDPSTVRLVSFGSFSSGFALKSSDMDLMLLSPQSTPSVWAPESSIPRILEKAFLQEGWGARLLARARVPIIRLCQSPPEGLMEALRNNRAKWDRLQGWTDHASVEAQGELHDDANMLEDDTPRAGDEMPGVVGSVTHEANDAKQKQASSSDDVTVSPQRPQEDIHRYYTRIKKAVGVTGDDSIWPHLSEDKEVQAALERQIVNAFLHGLSDDSLREHVLAHDSLRRMPSSLSPLNAWIHVQGEQIAMAWQSRAIKEVTVGKESEGDRLIQEWRHLHNRADLDKVGFEKTLHRLWHKLKTLASVRVALLSQRPRETGQSYYVRSAQILQDLLGLNVSELPAGRFTSAQHAAAHMFKRHFIGGIRNQSQRQHLEKFFDEHGEVSLSDLAKQLEAEQRISSWDAAIKDGSVPAVSRVTFETYASLIRKHGAASSVAAVKEIDKNLEEQGDLALVRKGAAQTLEFPKVGAGIQCDVIFSNHLALHNTVLLRCYCHCDARVRPMVLAIKAWAKFRDINTPYRGTLSSYGYVLMVLNFLANVARPPVVPNLQLAWTPPRQGSSTSALGTDTLVEGYQVRFWRDEARIIDLARKGMLTQNRQPLGMLLRQFFEYYACSGVHVIDRGFNWIMDVVSIRTRGGRLSKKSKNWTGARTTVTEPAQPGEAKKEVRHRYLLAIEDPFETDHNIARTVTHAGIVSIRGEFRRAWEIIAAHGKGESGKESIEELFKPIYEASKIQGVGVGVGTGGRDGPAVQVDSETGEEQKAE